MDLPGATKSPVPSCPSQRKDHSCERIAAFPVILLATQGIDGPGEGIVLGLTGNDSYLVLATVPKFFLIHETEVEDMAIDPPKPNGSTLGPLALTPSERAEGYAPTYGQSSMP